MIYFVHDFDPKDRRALLRWCRDDADGGDPWGWVMSDFLHYCPGVGGADISEERAEGLRELSDEALEHGARVLNRYDNLCRRAGLDY